MIVEDESLVAFEIATVLKKEGYSVCGIVDNGADAIEKAHLCKPDLIMMDINIDGHIDGIETASKIMRFSNSALIYLTAYIDDKTVDRAISTAPQSYLVKPFNRAELLASVKLALNKISEVDSNTDLKIVDLCDGYQFDLINRTLSLNNLIVKLTKKELLLLEILILNRGKIVTFETIDFELWSDKSVLDSARRMLLHRLRSKLGENCIETISGVGCTVL